MSNVKNTMSDDSNNISNEMETKNECLVFLKNECLVFLKFQTKRSIKWLLIQYSDICSDGDVFINDILNVVSAKIKTNTLEKLEWSDIISIDPNRTDSYIISMINHIKSSHKLFLEGKKADPWWAC